MAEDGLVVNFDIGDAPFKAKPLFKGGSWKARLTATKSAQFNRNKSAGLPNAPRPARRSRDAPSSGSNQTDLGARPAKKQRLDTADDTEYVRPERPRPQNKKPEQIVSSLFSFNPASTTSKEAPELVPETGEPTQPSNAPLDPALESFTSLGLSASLARHLLEKLEIKAPTAIQKAAITQLVSEDTDAFLQAETGSGKTLAYLLPIVQRLMSLGKDAKVHRDSGLFAIILAPTRELSKQISVVLESLLRCANWLVSGTVLGGEQKKREKARLRKGLNILVATPGRLVDHLEHTEVLNVSNVRWLVLDEGDRLMELGFEADVEKILEKLNRYAGRRTKIAGLPDKRNTILCSATMQTTVLKLGEMSLKDAVHIQGARGEEGINADGTDKPEKSFSAPAQLKQSYAVVPAKLRLVSLTAVLKRAFARKGSVMKAIVFISCADSVDFHFEVFARTPSSTSNKENDDSDTDTPSDPQPPSERTSASTPTLSSTENPTTLFKLHGSLPQAQRTSTLAAFAKHTNPSILICTDVASRGLDLPNVDLVIEYDPPFNREEHLHRIGRTARAGKEGRAMIFLQPGSEEGYVDVLKEVRNDAGTAVTRHDSSDILKKGFGTNIGNGKDWEEKTTEWQLEVERWCLENPTFLEQARRAYQSHIRAYATHIAAERGIFDMQMLHLGHLAKAFGLRDKPGSIRVPGLRPNISASQNKSDRRQNARDNKKVKSGGADHELPGAVDEQEAKRVMRARARMHSAGASEFNLG